MKFLQKRLVARVTFLFCIFAFLAQADFQPQRICKLRQKVSLDAGWKFFRNNPTGTGNPYDVAFSDAAWQTVNVPHSAMYVAPTAAAEATTMPNGTTWTGICWYRKTFTLPATAHTQKVFLEFEGAMQNTSVYLNGTLIGGHGASGFTGFSFDISSAVNRTGQNVLAIKLDCTYSINIPPGNVLGGPNGGEYPDYYIFSGLYRDVWLVCADNVSIPLYGQKITTPQATSTSATVRIQTTVNNAGAAAASCIVQSVVVNASNAIVAQASASGSVAANGSTVFDCTTPAISNPGLWSPETPNLYRVFTKVLVNNVAVDDNVERIGIRSLDWRAAGGFFLNGSRYLLKGVDMHQEFAWVGMALPNSRYFEDVRLVKNMGANAIRCAHYPRDPAFYDACDELGVLCEPELPTWGGGVSQYPAIFWTRMDTCAQEMVKVAINHPSIIIWGLFNEGADWPTQITSLHNRVKSLDSTRFTSRIDNNLGADSKVVDVFGANYGTTPNWANARYYNAEYHEGWMYFCNRGDTVTKSTTVECFGGGCVQESENQYANERYTLRWLRDILPNTGDTKPLAGGHMWCFIDYWSPCNVGNHCMGVLDHYRIPKEVFYTFQTAWRTGVTDDYPASGLTPAKVQLEADVTNLVADSTDLSRIIGSIRDASGKCVWSSAPIVFSVTGPVDVFEGNPVTENAIAGKIGIIIKSKNTPGTITVTATSTGLASATLTLTAAAADTSALPFIWTGSAVGHGADQVITGKNVSIRQTVRSIIMAFPSRYAEAGNISLVNVQGKTVACPLVRREASVIMNTSGVAPGVYRLLIQTPDRTISKTITMTK
jgi:Beta-galactosidase/beta-glucuronidase